MELDDIEFEEAESSQPSKEPQQSNTDVDTSGLTDESISEELIREMKMLGIAKPEGVSHTRWNAVMHDSLVHNHMIQMRAAGASYTKIAEQLGYSASHVSTILKTPKIRAKVDEVIREMYGDDYKKAMQARASKALAVYDEILDNPDSNIKIKLAAAQQVMEHTIGKPQQTVEHKGGMLSELILKADQLREANNPDIELTKEPDKIDNLVKELLPTNMVVGKRAKVE